jgi:hypothetical protein
LIKELRVHDLTQHAAEDIFVDIYANIDAVFRGNADRIDQIEALWILVRTVEFLHMRLHKSLQHAERAERLLDRLTQERNKLTMAPDLFRGMQVETKFREESEPF